MTVRQLVLRSLAYHWRTNIAVILGVAVAVAVLSGALLVGDSVRGSLRALVLDFGAINETSGFEQGGILGGDFLRHYRLTIDFSRAQLALQPHTPAPAN